jgi:hypothetical protein
MSKTLAAVLLPCFLVINPAHSADSPKNISGYGKTTWGMSPDEVISAETPRAKRLEPPKQFKKGLGLVTIEGIKIEGASFNAVFVFDESGKKLGQVNLTSTEEKNPGVNVLTFSSLEKLLMEKYGQPSFKEGARRIAWRMPITSINLTHLNIPGVISMVIVSYKPTKATDEAARDL